MSSRKVRFFFNDNLVISYINDDLNDITLYKQTLDEKNLCMYDKKKSDKDKFNYYELFKGYERSLNGLISFRNDLNKWASEIPAINYKKYYDHKGATMCVFKSKSACITKKLKIENDEKNNYYNGVKYFEFDFFEKCNNGGLISLDKSCIGITKSCYGYDYSAFYPNMLARSTLKMAIREGTKIRFSGMKQVFILNPKNKYEEYTNKRFEAGEDVYKKECFVGEQSIKEEYESKHNIKVNNGINSVDDIQLLDLENLKYGIYNIHISSDDERFNKIFSYSKYDVYTHYSVKFAYACSKKYNVMLNLVADDEDPNKTNALVYDDSQLRDTSIIFNDWYNYTMDLKKKYPNNQLVKHITSSLWGALIQYDRKFVDDKDFWDMDVSELYQYNETEYKLIKEKYYGLNNTKYELIKSNKAYVSNFARLKPFLVSYARAYIGNLIIDEDIIDDVVRIQTDNITLNKPHDFTHLSYYPKPEEKTTGTIKFDNANLYHHYCEKFDTYYKYTKEDYKKHNNH